MDEEKEEKKINMNGYMEKRRGITLVALVVTIIILLILAGVSAFYIAGDNGIINKAITAKENEHFDQDEEKLQLDLVEWEKSNAINRGTLIDFLKERTEYDVEKVKSGILVTIKDCGHQYIVSEDLLVAKADGQDTEPDVDVEETGSKIEGTKLILSDDLPSGTYTLKYENVAGALAEYADICTINTEESREYDDFIEQNTAPVDATIIGIYDSQGERVDEIKLGFLDSSSLTGRKYSFAAFSDVHIDATSSRVPQHLKDALTYIEGNDDINFTAICGDFSEGGTETNLKEYKKIVDEYATKPVYAIGGNHEPKVFKQLDYETLRPYTDQPLYYTINQGDDVFIMVGIYKNPSSGDIFTEGELQWLYNTLEENRNKRCFLFMHLNPENGSGDAIKKDNDVRIKNSHQQGKIFYSLVSHYTNVIWFHGHTHEKFEYQALNKLNNYDKVYGCHSIHIPSLGYPRYLATPDATSLSSDKNASEGYVVDVYENNIVLKGRDFIGKKFLPIASYSLDTTLKTIEAKTYKDPTNTLNTN